MFCPGQPFLYLYARNLFSGGLRQSSPPLRPARSIRAPSEMDEQAQTGLGSQVNILSVLPPLLFFHHSSSIIFLIFSGSASLVRGGGASSGYISGRSNLVPMSGFPSNVTPSRSLTSAS